MHKTNRPHTIVAREKYAWPGGYLMVSIMSDSALLCPDCVRANYRQIARSTREKSHDGWQVVAADCLANFDADGDTCAHCNRTLETL